MPASRVSRCWSLALLAFAVSAAVAVPPASASPWSLGAGIGAIAAENMRSNEEAAPSFAAFTGSISAERRLHRLLGLRLEAEYFRSRHGVGLSWVPENPPPSEWRAQHYVPISLGLRLHSPERGLRTRGFAQIGPSLLVAHFTRTGVLRSGGPLYGQPMVETRIDESATRLVPAVTGTFGLRARTSDHTAAELGLHSVVSGKIGRVRLASGMITDYGSLEAFALTMGWSWTP